MSQLLDQWLRSANPVPNPTDPPSGAWAADVALLEIERRSDSVETIERTTTEPSQPKRNRGWLLAAAVAALVVLIGAVAIGLRSDSGTDVVEPTPTTLSAPTTVPATTLPQATTVPATTVPATTAPAATVPPPQAFEATVTWDGETCTFDGPAEARVRDTLSLTVMNNTERFGRFVVMYVVSGTTIDDVSAYFDDELGNILTPQTPGWSFPGPNLNVRNTSPPPPFNWVDEFGAIQAGGSATLDITIRQPRVHVFTCEGADDGSNQSDRYIDNAPQAITVTE